MTEALIFATGAAFGFASTVGALAWQALDRQQRRTEEGRK